MAHLRNPYHPYNPNFALPDNVLAEPPGRGTITTAQLPRRTFGPVPKNWDGCGYALPEYIRNEPHGRGAVTTYQRRRRTIPMQLPEALSGSGPGGIPLWMWGAAAGVAFYLWRKKR